MLGAEIRHNQAHPEHEHAKNERYGWSAIHSYLPNDSARVSVSILHRGHQVIESMSET